MSKSYLTTLLLLLLAHYINFAQSNEYVISYNNDTIYGDVKRKSNLLNPSKVSYKITLSNGKRVDISPKEIKKIYTIDGVDGDNYFEAYAEYCFIKIIIDGRIKLYQLPDIALFYISKDNSEIQTTSISQLFSNKKAHGEIADLLRDKPRILEEFNKLEGTFQNISYIINKYNKRLKPYNHD